MEGRIDAIVIGAGTSGTFVGVSRAVKKINPHVLCVLVEPEGSIYGGHPPGPKKIEGIGQKDFIPEIFVAGSPALQDSWMAGHRAPRQPEFTGSRNGWARAKNCCCVSG